MNDVRMDAPDETIPRGPYAALKYVNYRRFAGGWIISTIGIQMMATAIGWELYERTHDALKLGLVGLVQAIPVIFFALPAGQVADLIDRRRIVFLSQLCMCLCATGLALTSLLHGPILLIYGLLFLAGCAKAFNSPARASLLPLIVPPEIFANAVTWNSSAFQFAAMSGPYLGGLLIAWTHAAWPVYATTAVGTLVFAFAVSLVRPRAMQRTGGAMNLRSMAAGASYLLHERTVLAALTLDLFAVLLGGAASLMPIYAKDILHVGPDGLGLLRAAPYIGAFVMALVLAHRPPMQRAGPALLWSVTGFGLATIVFGLSNWFPLSLCCLLVAGALDNISVVVRHVLVQVRTPDALRGRVSAVNSVFIESSNELGGFESGLVASWFSPVISVVAGGIGTIVVVATIALAWPEIRRLRRLDASLPTSNNTA